MNERRHEAPVALLEFKMESRQDVIHLRDAIGALAEGFTIERREWARALPELPAEMVIRDEADLARARAILGVLAEKCHELAARDAAAGTPSPWYQPVPEVI